MSDGLCLELQVRLPASPAEVWTAITTVDGMAGWFAPMEVQPHVGGSSPFGTVQRWEPPAYMEIRGESATDAPADEFIFEVRPADHGAVLRFTHTGFVGETGSAQYEVEMRGWSMYFATLAEFLRHFPGRTAVFVDAQAPESSAGARAWAAVLAELGLGDHAALGDPVRLTLDGLVSIDGILDYLAPGYVGVRNSDALYRFHGRLGSSLPVALGHHLFAFGVDRAAAIQLWSAWLESAVVERSG